jgi:glycolate oxidase FAD binding subunit
MSIAPALGLDAARALDPARFAVGGRVPRAALKPVSQDEVAEAVRAATRERLAVLPWGGGTTLPLEDAPERYDVALDLTALDRVVEYEPEDLTLTAECGVRIAALARQVGSRGQLLPIEVALADRATLGGALGANASGPRRFRLGAPRDRILGARFVLSEGTIARTGGRVVKNVTGYAIHRLLCGSRGGLGIVLEASLKLAPAPAARAALVFAATPRQLANAERWTFLPRLEPAYVSVLGPHAVAALATLGAAAVAAPFAGEPGAFAVVVGLEDDAPWVANQRASIEKALGAPLAHLEGPEADRLSGALADVEAEPGVRLTLVTAWNSPAALGVISGTPAADRGVFHALSGRLYIFPAPEDAPEVVRALEAGSFGLIGARGAGECGPTLPPQAAVAELRARIRGALDPTSTWALGPRWEREP